MYDSTAVFALQRKKLDCVKLKALQNLPFQLAKICILNAKFEIFFAKNSGDRIKQYIHGYFD